jgi:acyl-CoA thioester hydrolase
VSEAGAALSWPDLAGRIVAGEGGRRHLLPIRVYYEDTDFSGFVYHASYLRFIERGRSDFLRLAGVHHRELLAGTGGTKPCAFVVRRMSLDFLKPARIDELLEVETRVDTITQATFELRQTVRRDATVVFAATVQVVLVSLDGRPQRLPGSVRDAITAG